MELEVGRGLLEDPDQVAAIPGVERLAVALDVVGFGAHPPITITPSHSCRRRWPTSRRRSGRLVESLLEPGETSRADVRRLPPGVHVGQVRGAARPRKTGSRRSPPGSPATPPAEAARALAAGLVEHLEQLVGGELDLLVAPLRGPVVAGDQAGAMHAAQVAVDERVAGLGLVGGALGEPQVPGRVLVPRVASRGTCSPARRRAAPRPSRCRARTGAPRSARARGRLPWC